MKKKLTSLKSLTLLGLLLVSSCGASVFDPASLAPGDTALSPVGATQVRMTAEGRIEGPPVTCDAAGICKGKAEIK